MEEIRSVRRNQIRAALKYQQPWKLGEDIPASLCCKEVCPHSAAAHYAHELLAQL